MKSEPLTVRNQNSRYGIGTLCDEILRRRYLHKNQNGQVIETPEQMFRRVADVIAAVDRKHGVTDVHVQSLADEFYLLLLKGIFLPKV